MNRSMRLAAVALAAAALGACGRTQVLPGTCRQVTCPSGFTCDPFTGECREDGADGLGEFDGGPFSDGGPDTGSGDAGVDAGRDAGPDAGPGPCPGGCVAPQFCDPEANGAAGACVTCNAQQGCGGDTPYCDLSVPGGACVACLSDADCAETRPFCDLSTHQCQTRSNDTCFGAQTLVFTNGAASIAGTTRDASNDNPTGAKTPACSPSARKTGADVVYTFALSQAQDVRLTITPTGPHPTFRPVMYVRGPSVLAACDSDTELGCVSANSGPSSAQTLLLPNLQPGTYFVWVDSALQTSGPFQLDAELLPPTTNDTCTWAAPLTFVNGTATATGDTRSASNDNALTDASPTCSTSAKLIGADLVYSYTLNGTRDVTVTVTPTGPNPTFAPVVYVRKSPCSDASTANEQGCATGFTASAQTLQLPAQPAGTWYIWVDGALGTSGPFQLEVSTSAASGPPANDTCSAPQVLAVGSTVTGDTTQASDDYSRISSPAYSAACLPNGTDPYTGHDLVYQFTATASSHTLTLTPATNFDPALMVLSPTCGASACVSQSDTLGNGNSETITVHTTPGTLWFVVVDSWSGSAGYSSGAFTLSLQ